MFVQAGRYMHRHNASDSDMMKFRCYGVEKEPDTVKLAKMNLLLNNVRGEITEANSYYSDPYNAVGRFDYVMANPPFNGDEVVYEKVKDDSRFNTYGIPKNKTKAEEQKVKLAAKNLYNKLTAEKDELLVVDWYKDDQPKLKVKSAIEHTLDEDLPESYDKESFEAKTDLLLNHFIDMAIQGYGWIAA